MSGAILAGCGGDKKTSGQSTNQSTQTAKEETITDIFAKSKKVDALSYDYSITSNETAINGKVWMQGNKMKTESVFNGETMISFFDGDTNTIITYYPAQNKAMKLTSDQAEKQNAISDTPIDYTEDIDTTSVKVLETTVYDGVKCKVVEITEKDSKVVSKMWIREDYGIPIRVETTDPTFGKSVMEYKNMKIGSISADVFKVPAVEVTDMSEMMKQMLPNMPGGQQ